MGDRFLELNVFVRAAETGSFSATARELGLSQPSVSRIVSDLETRLGVKLMLRTTRRIVPTDAGAAFLQRARQILYDLDEADESARGADSLKGTLRIAVSTIVGVKTIIPSLPAFLQDHPQLKIEMLMADSMHDLVAEGVDVAIRLGRLEDSGFGAKKLATLDRLLLASPAYIAARGKPREPADLVQHDCVFGPSGVPSRPWVFYRDGAPVSVKVEPRFLMTSAEALIACAREGLGIARAAALMCRRELDAGELVPLMPGYSLDPVDVHAVFPAGRMPSQKVRLFTAHLSRILA
jgi:DNA-binding transcriptional LysR family regulator